MTYYIISQQTIANLLNTLPTEDSTRVAVFIQGRMKMEFENPTAVREVVRCKDCIRYRPDGEVWGRCTVMSNRMRKKDFCSYGERKDSEQA